MFDGKSPHWYHAKCFFMRNRPKAVGDFSHFDSLRWEDQETIRSMLEAKLKVRYVLVVLKKKNNKKNLFSRELVQLQKAKRKIVTSAEEYRLVAR